AGIRAATTTTATATTAAASGSRAGTRTRGRCGHCSSSTAAAAARTPLGNAVVGHGDNQRERLPDPRCARLLALDLHHRRLVRAPLRAARTGAEGAGLRGDHDIVNQVVGAKRRVGLVGPAVGGQRPDELL